jgi:hypothetical protein
MSRIVFITSKRLHGASTVTRALQIAPLIGGVVNPWFVRRSDVAFMVKRFDLRAARRARMAWCDINDEIDCFDALRANPRAGVVVLTEVAARWVGAQLQNPIVCIPIHHCNLEGRLRKAGPVKRVVISGDRFLLDRALVREKLLAEGFDLVEVPGQAPREAHCAALATGDIALAWSPEPVNALYPLELKPPLKLVNAGSFGVPFVAYPEPGYAGLEAAYVPVRSLDAIIEACVRLREDADHYDRVSRAGTLAATPFHISRIAARYTQLLTWNR